MNNKVSLVTGANGGMGKAIATELARQGATVVLVSRNRRKGEEAQAEIAAATGNPSLDLLVADLSGSPSDLVKPVCLFKKVMEEPFRLCAPP